MVKATQNAGPWKFCMSLWNQNQTLMKDVEINCMYAEKFVPLFDGKTFNGFECDRDWFTIRDGAIIAGSFARPSPISRYATTEKKYGDFERRPQASNSSPEVNGGI